jgi:hypothetical protein
MGEKMKKIFRSVCVVGVLVMGGQAEALDKFNFFSVPKTPLSMADQIGELKAPQEIIDLDQLKDENGAALLNQKIPLGKFELYNPPEIYQKVIKLNLDGAYRMFMVDHYHIWDSHWAIEDTRRLVVGLFGLYILPTAFSTTLLAGTGAGLAWSYWGCSSLGQSQERSTFSGVMEKIGFNKTLSDTLEHQENPRLEPVYKITKDGVKCIYQTYLRQNIFGKSLGVHIELTPVKSSEK